MCACVQAEKDQEEMLRQAARLKGKKSVEVAAAAATSTFANATLYDREEGTKLIAKIRKDKKEGQYDQDARLAVECFKTLNAYKPLRQFFKELVADSNEARGAGAGANKTKSEAFDDIARRNKGKVMSLLNFQHFLKLYRIVPFLITSTQATAFFYRANPGHATGRGGKAEVTLPGFLTVLLQIAKDRPEYAHCLSNTGKMQALLAYVKNQVVRVMNGRIQRCIDQDRIGFNQKLPDWATTKVKWDKAEIPMFLNVLTDSMVVSELPEDPDEPPDPSKKTIKQSLQARRRTLAEHSTTSIKTACHSCAGGNLTVARRFAKS